MSEDRVRVSYNSQTGAFEYEGPHEFLLLSFESLRAVAPVVDIEIEETKAPVKRKTAAARKEKAPAAMKNTKGSSHKPKYNAQLDLLGLDEFYAKHELKNNSELVLAFVYFISEKVKKETVDWNDVYTCFDYLKSKIKIPKNFVSTFKNAQNKDRVVTYETGYTNIEMTPQGINLLNHEIANRKKV